MTSLLFIMAPYYKVLPIFVLFSSAFPRNAELEEKIRRVRKVPGLLRGIMTMKAVKAF